jgi:hypothetical protein
MNPILMKPKKHTQLKKITRVIKPFIPLLGILSAIILFAWIWIDILNSKKNPIIENIPVLNLKNEEIFQKERIFSEKEAKLESEEAFKELLDDINQLIMEDKIKRRSCFISYAWEDESTINGRKANRKLQNWLNQLSDDLERAGIKTFLDIKCLKGNINHWMKNNIAQSDYIILIGTPRYQKRITNGSNVALELGFIREKLKNETKVKNNPNVLIPILYEGSFDSSFPEDVKSYLIRDFIEPRNYHHCMVELSSPLGIIPHIYPELQGNNKYKSLLAKFNFHLKEIEYHKELERLKNGK